MTAGLSSGPRIQGDLSRVSSGLTRGPNKARKRIGGPALDGAWPIAGASMDIDFLNNRGYSNRSGYGIATSGMVYACSTVSNYFDSSGVLQQAAANTLVYDYMNVTNVFPNLGPYSQAFSQWTQSGLTATDNATTAPDGTSTASSLVENTATNTQRSVGIIGGQINLVFPIGATSTLSFYVKNLSGSRYVCAFGATNGCVWFDLAGGTVAKTSGTTYVSSSITSVGSGWYRCVATFTKSADDGVRIGLASTTAGTTAATYTGDGTSGVYLWGAQLELGSSATTYQPTYLWTSEFVQTPTTTQGGLRIENSATNNILWCRDATNAAWTKTNVTATKDQTGIDNTANSATRLTATSAGGTCAQGVTLGSAIRGIGVYLKRITGTGTVSVSVNGTNYVNVDLSSGAWVRSVQIGTVTNPQISIKLAVLGDEVAMDYAQIENGMCVSSPILTTTATVTRAQTTLEYSGQNGIGIVDPAKGTVLAKFMPGYRESGTTPINGIVNISQSVLGSAQTINLDTNAGTYDFRTFFGSDGKVLSLSSQMRDAGVVTRLGGSYAAATPNNLFVKSTAISVGGDNVVSGALAGGSGRGNNGSNTNMGFVGFGWQNVSGANSHNQVYLQRIVYFPKILTESQLKELLGTI